GWGASPGAAPPAPAGPEEERFFEARVRPVLAEHCQGCHGTDKQKGGLRLDSRAALLKGGDNGPVVKPGDPDGSPLVQAARRTGALKRPPKGKRPPAAIES